MQASGHGPGGQTSHLGHGHATTFRDHWLFVEGVGLAVVRVVRKRGEVGAQVQDIESRQTRLEDQNITTKELLSKIEDTDFTQAISEFSLLQTSLQASLQTTGQVLNISLIDFLR